MIQRSPDRPKHSVLEHVPLCIVAGVFIVASIFINTRVFAKTYFNTQQLEDGYNAYHMAILSALAYEDEVLAKKSYQNLGLTQCKGSTKIKILDEAHDNTSGHLSTDGERIFLVMRGTDDAQDIIKNFKLVSTLRKGWGDVPIHKGFSEVVDSFITSTHLYEKLKLCGADKEIYVGGHSLGGALANIIAIELKLNQFKIKGIYTYGAPRVGGKAWISYFNQSFHQHHFQWRNVHDPIPSVPKGSLKKRWTSHATGFINHQKTKHRYMGFKHLLLGHQGALKVTYENLNPFDGKGTFSYHNKKKYAFDLWKKFSLTQRIHNELSPLSLLNVGKLSKYCSTDDHCQKGHYCSTVGKNKCKAKKKIGTFCLRSKMCTSEHCVMGQCRPPKSSKIERLHVIPNDPPKE